MEIVKTNCPRCQRTLEFPKDFDNIICESCGTAFRVREYKGTINLSVREPARSSLAEQNGASGLAIIEERLQQLDEMIEEVGASVEALKSREQSMPLQIGCA